MVNGGMDAAFMHTLQNSPSPLMEAGGRKQCGSLGKRLPQGFHVS